jgi:N6-adenosine-specific RNA methylase IME4
MDQLDELIPPSGRRRETRMEYDVILADPPWHFQNYSADEPGMLHDRQRGPNRYYPTMLTKDIGALPIADMAAKDAVLFMWACWPLLPDAFEVIKAWGFDYKSLAWVWVKANRSGMGFFTGMGYYTRANSEPCLLATRGNLPKPADRGIQALIYAPVREHSRKPDDQYRKIEALYPGKRYLELFARRKRTGWDAWGNQVDCDIEITTRPQPVLFLDNTQATPK